METQKITTRIAKLLSGTRKPGEGFATVFIYEPKDFLEKQHGNLYFVLEIASGSESAMQVGEIIINAIKDEFYKDLSRNVILSFESALRNANEELSDITSAGETDWIGKLNVACAIISEGKLHLSKVGETEAYIIRGENIKHISEGLSVEEKTEKQKHPLKTFSTITSGTLKPDDKLLLSSSELLYHISLTGIKKIVAENTPSNAIIKIKELLKNEDGVSSVGVLIIEIITQDKLSKETGIEPDEIWIEEPKPTKEKILGLMAAILTATISFLKTIPPFIKTKALPKLAKLKSDIKNKIDEKRKKDNSNKEETDFTDNKEIQVTENENIENIDEEKIDSEKENTTKNKSHPNIRTKKENFITFVKNYFKNFSFDKFIKDIKESFLKIQKSTAKKAKSPFIKLFAVVFILFIISISVLIRNHYVNKNMQEIKSKLNKATELFNKAEGAFIYDARLEAKNYLDQSKILVEEVLKTKYYKSEASELISKISANLKKANGIVEINPNLVSELDNNSINEFVFLDKKIYFVDSEKLISINIENKEKNEYELPENNYNGIAAFPRKNSIAIFTDTDKLVEFNIKTEKNLEISVKENLKQGASFENYHSYLYILSPQENQIFRYARLALDYSKPTNVITDKNANIKNAISLTVPGYFLLLTKEGKILKVTKGNTANLDILEMPLSFKNPLKIESLEGNSNIYVLDKELGIVILNTKGQYKKVLDSEKFEDIKDFAIDEESATIYILSGNKIFSFGTQN